MSACPNVAVEHIKQSAIPFRIVTKHARHTFATLTNSYLYLKCRAHIKTLKVYLREWRTSVTYCHVSWNLYDWIFINSDECCYPNVRQLLCPLLLLQWFQERSLGLGFVLENALIFPEILASHGPNHLHKSFLLLLLQLQPKLSILECGVLDTVVLLDKVCCYTVLSLILFAPEQLSKRFAEVHPQYHIIAIWPLYDK